MAQESRAAQRPWYFRAMAWVSARMSERTLERIIAPLIRGGLRVMSRQLNPIWGRILSFQSAPVRNEDLLRIRVEAAQVLTKVVVGMFSLQRVYETECPRDVKLELLPVVERLRERGRGVILATPHFGDIFMGIVALAHRGLPLSVIYAFGHRYDWLRIKNARVLGLGMAAAPAMAALSRNELVMTFDDVEWFATGRAAEFFGAPIKPPSGAARLALASGAPILPVYSVLDGGVSRLLCDEPIVVDADSAQESLEDGLLRSMERFIGRHPSHWFAFLDIWNLKEMSGRHRRSLFPYEQKS